jgi:hypothetical protein
MDVGGWGNAAGFLCKFCMKRRGGSGAPGIGGLHSRASLFPPKASLFPTIFYGTFGEANIFGPNSIKSHSVRYSKRSFYMLGSLKLISPMNGSFWMILGGQMVFSPKKEARKFYVNGQICRASVNSLYV